MTNEMAPLAVDADITLKIINENKMKMSRTLLDGIYIHIFQQFRIR